MFYFVFYIFFSHVATSELVSEDVISEFSVQDMVSELESE